MLLEQVKLRSLDLIQELKLEQHVPTSRGNGTTSSSKPMSSLSLIDEDEEMNY